VIFEQDHTTKQVDEKINQVHLALVEKYYCQLHLVYGRSTDQGSVPYKRYKPNSQSPQKMENANEGSARAMLFRGKTDRTMQLV